MVSPVCRSAIYGADPGHVLAFAGLQQGGQLAQAWQWDSARDRDGQALNKVLNVGGPPPNRRTNFYRGRKTQRRRLASILPIPHGRFTDFENGRHISSSQEFQTLHFDQLVKLIPRTVLEVLRAHAVSGRDR